jgi:hypothetical protein
MYSLILATNINKMPGTGVELSSIKPSKTPISTKSGAKCGALDDKKHPELARLIEVWPTLPKQTKAKIRDLIEKHIMEGKADDGKKEKN